jgi:hypothetical protein
MQINIPKVNAYAHRLISANLIIQKEIIAPNINFTNIPAWTIATADTPDICFEYHINAMLIKVRNKLTPNPTKKPLILQYTL